MLIIFITYAKKDNILRTKKDMRIACPFCVHKSAVRDMQRPKVRCGSEPVLGMRPYFLLESLKGIIA